MFMYLPRVKKTIQGYALKNHEKSYKKKEKFHTKNFNKSYQDLVH